MLSLCEEVVASNVCVHPLRLWEGSIDLDKERVHDRKMELVEKVKKSN